KLRALFCGGGGLGGFAAFGNKREEKFGAKERLLFCREIMNTDRGFFDALKGVSCYDRTL
ncbi:MAG: hypothetical protein RR821_14360, partial [Clostridia bacterium]